MAETFDMLTSVKNALGITGNYQDATLATYITELQDYIETAGVAHEVAVSERAAGLISRGVADLWAYGSGDGALSPYFHERATQLALATGGSNE